jgi:hypothetical protein
LFRDCTCEGMNAPLSPNSRIAAASLFFRPTSKMSHAGSWHAACRIRISKPWFRFGHREEARSVTDPGVGSGALLDAFSVLGITVQIATTNNGAGLAFILLRTVLS